jgi:hypothetical protein
MVSLSSDIVSLLVKLWNIVNQEFTMQKRMLFLGLGLSILLTACAGKATPPPATATPTLSPSPTATLPSPTATELSPTQTPTGSPVLVDVPSGCSTYTLLPTPDAAAVEAFPNNLPGDWAKGLETASLTIVEYSDFQ